MYYQHVCKPRGLCCTYHPYCCWALPFAFLGVLRRALFCAARALNILQDEEVLDAMDMRSVVTSSCTAPLGSDPPGFRVFRVFSRRIEYEYYPIDGAPLEVDVEGEHA